MFLLSPCRKILKEGKVGPVINKLPHYGDVSRA